MYRARDTVSGRIVALKKVRFDNLEPESVKFMAREILILRRLDHPNIIKLEGLVTSRMSCSLYLVFEYMEHDLAGLAASCDVKFTLPQVCETGLLFQIRSITWWNNVGLMSLCYLADKMLHTAAVVRA